MAESFTKAKLIAELAATAKLTKAGVGRVLDGLTEIAYREAVNGFVVPGICKLKVIQKKASRRRNPITGQVFMIGERKAVKIVPLKKAKTAIAPNPDVVITMLETPPPAPAQQAAAPSAEPAPAGVQQGQPQPSAPVAHPPAMSAPGGEEGQIVFPCNECGSMLAASPKTAGQGGECPFCGAKTVVPMPQSQPAGEKQSLDGQPHAGATSVSDFVLFVCKACGQEIEAPIDMIGMDAECPTCGSSVAVPLASPPPPPVESAPEKSQTGEIKVNKSSMTIRIDLSDLE